MLKGTQPVCVNVADAAVFCALALAMHYECSCKLTALTFHGMHCSVFCSCQPQIIAATPCGWRAAGGVAGHRHQLQWYCVGALCSPQLAATVRCEIPNTQECWGGVDCQGTAASLAQGEHQQKLQSCAGVQLCSSAFWQPQHAGLQICLATETLAGCSLLCFVRCSGRACLSRSSLSARVCKLAEVSIGSSRCKTLDQNIGAVRTTVSQSRSF